MSRIYLDGEVWFCSVHPDPDACDCPRPPAPSGDAPRLLLRCCCKEIGHTGGCLACSDNPQPVPAALWMKKYGAASRKFMAALRADGLEMRSADPCGERGESAPASEHIHVPPPSGLTPEEPDSGDVIQLKPWTGQVFDQRQLPEPYTCARCGLSFCMCR